MTGTNLLHYRILEKLGAGGQGTVYKALDTKLGRTVVIKILPRELTVKEANLKRFEREARLASSLDHQNICTIFDMDQVEGTHFIAMQYVKGRTVRSLVNGRPLELRSALLIAIQVADALAAAHASGIIHRDIKANNVMVTETGQVKVLDFGLAKLLDGEAEHPANTHQGDLTEIGVPYGTATYAAPEQARGDRVDKRADIFSTGVLLYEMLTGTWPFHGKTSIDVRHAVLHDTPAPLAQKRPAPVPPRLQEVLDKALAKEPAERYQKMEEFRDAMRALLPEASGSSSAGAPLMPDAAYAAPRHLPGTNPVSRAVRWLRSITSQDAQLNTPEIASTSELNVHVTTPTSVGEQDKKSVAVLPFRNLSADPASSFYEFSLADTVITELARVRSLVVRPSSVISRYQGKDLDPCEIGRELRVRAILTAGFMHAGGRLRVTAQLLDVNTSEILWSDRIDTPAEDVIVVQDTIAQRIVDALRIELSSDEQEKMARRATANAAAYDEYLRGRDLFGRFIFRTLAPEDCEAAIEHFRRASRLDPAFALAHDGLGACYANRVIKGYGGGDDYLRAEAAFKDALALDPELVEARMLMVPIYLWHGEKQRARYEVALMRDKAPNEAVVYFVKGLLHRLDGEYERSLRSWRHLTRLDPAAQIVATYHRALISLFEGRARDAMRAIDGAATLEGESPMLKTARALAFYYLGEFAKAAEQIQQVIRLHPNQHGLRPVMAMCLSGLGDHQSADAELNEDVRTHAAADPDAAYWLASAYALQDRRDEAIEWLERAMNIGNENRAWFERDPTWTQLRSDQRFFELMNRMPPPTYL